MSEGSKKPCLGSDGPVLEGAGVPFEVVSEHRGADFIALKLAVETGKPVAMKFDVEKPRMDLLDRKALDGLAKVLTFGANKYSANNWRGGFNYSRLTAAAMRHLLAVMDGEDIDPESGLPHIDHLGCCWMFLSNMMKTRPDLDDRHKE